MRLGLQLLRRAASVTLREIASIRSLEQFGANTTHADHHHHRSIIERLILQVERRCVAKVGENENEITLLTKMTSTQHYDGGATVIH